MDTTTSGYVISFHRRVFRLQSHCIQSSQTLQDSRCIRRTYESLDTRSLHLPRYSYQEELIAFAIREGYLQDADEFQEIHIGSYGKLKIDEDLANTTFFPRKLK